MTIPPQDKTFADWYNDIVQQSGVAEYGTTRGCIVFKPYGFALWEHIQRLLDASFKELGHQNTYFPLLIPLSHFAREAEHVEGFAKECAVVTHYRLQANEKKVDIDPTAKLEEPLVVRPTSETVIWEHFGKWIQSHRDLPVRINQWANVVRWEKRTRPFLRTLEFLWQEGHTAHATAEEAHQHALTMLHNYQRIFSEDFALPVVIGEKTSHERFAGAVHTYTLEGLMQDGKALQLGTSHFLGQNFAKAFKVTYANAKGVIDHVWGTSWGTTTRLIGALIMVHGDKKGLLLPPRIAPIQVVCIPIYRKSVDSQRMHAYIDELAQRLRVEGIRVEVDKKETQHPGRKFHHYEQKGVPIRISIGPRDLQKNTVEIVRRDTSNKETLPMSDMVTHVQKVLTDMQRTMYEKAVSQQRAATHYVDTFEAFQEVVSTQKGFIMAHWDGTTATEIAIQEATKATIRCIPLDAPQEEGKCVYSGKPSQRRVLFAIAY